MKNPPNLSQPFSRLLVAAALLSFTLMGPVHAASPIVIDNGAAQFSTTGAWPTEHRGDGL